MEIIEKIKKIEKNNLNKKYDNLERKSYNTIDFLFSICGMEGIVTEKNINDLSNRDDKQFGNILPEYSIRIIGEKTYFLMVRSAREVKEDDMPTIYIALTEISESELNIIKFYYEVEMVQTINENRYLMLTIKRKGAE
jgi:hypothetical protein